MFQRCRTLSHHLPPPNLQTQTHICDTSGKDPNRPLKGPGWARSPTGGREGKRSPPWDWPRRWVDRPRPSQTGTGHPKALLTNWVCSCTRRGTEGGSKLQRRERRKELPKSLCGLCPAPLEEPQVSHCPASLASLPLLEESAFLQAGLFNEAG